MEEDKEGDVQPVSELAQVVERLEKANAEKKALLDREEKLEAVKRLGGQTSNVPKELPKEETPQEYAKRVSGGRVK